MRKEERRRGEKNNKRSKDEDEEGRLEISEEAIAKMFENSLKDTSREAADLVIRESLMVGVVIDVKDLLGGEFIGMIPGEFSDSLDIAQQRREDSD